MITLGCWLRNLFTDEDGEWSTDRIRMLATVVMLAGVGFLAYACRDLPATSQQTVTVTVNDPGGAPVTVIVNQP